MIPALLKKYVPSETALGIFDWHFNSAFDLLKNGLYKANASTQELLFSSVIDFAQTERSIKEVCRIFLECDKTVVDAEGRAIEGLEVSTRQKHSMVKRIYSSKDISHEVKLQAMAKLEA
jgi:hypothetical protein